jgi:hypothetical protein
MRLKTATVLDLFLLPFALGFAFDVSITTRFVIILAFFVGGYRCGSVSIFLLRIWQAMCLSALISLLLWRVSDQLVTPMLAFALFLLTLVGFLWNSGFNQTSLSTIPKNGTLKEIVALLGVLFVAYQAPRGRSTNLRYLIAEDNEGWLRTPLSVLRTNDLDLQLVFDTTSIQYFIKFSLNSFLHIFKPFIFIRDSDAATAINIVSNSWVFLAISAVLLTLAIFDDFFTNLNQRSPSLLLLSAVAAISIAFFRASLLNGHYAQLLLNVVVYTFILSIVELSRRLDARGRRASAVVALSTAAAMVGSYNPWIGVSAGAIFLVVDSIFRPSLLTRIFSNKKSLLLVPILLPIFWFTYKSLSSRYGALDDGGGVWVLGLNPIVLFVLFYVSLIALALIFKFRGHLNFDVKDVHSKNFSFARPVLLIGFFILGPWFAIPPRHYFWDRQIALIFVLGVLVLGVISRNFRIKILDIKGARSYISILILCFGSLCFVIYVWLASRFGGLVLQPMYAAHKSVLAFTGQFFWVPFAILFSVHSQTTKFKSFLRDGVLSGLYILMIGVYPILRNSADQASINSLINSAGDWWIEPTLAAHDRDNQALVVCVNGDASVDAFSVYNCNRFSSTLSLEGEVANSFRGVAWNNPDSYLRIPEILSSIDSSRRIVVLVNGQLTEETRGLLAGPYEKIEIIEVG